MQRIGSRECVELKLVTALRVISLGSWSPRSEERKAKIATRRSGHDQPAPAASLHLVATCAPLSRHSQFSFSLLRLASPSVRCALPGGIMTISASAIADLELRNPCDATASQWETAQAWQKFVGPCPLHSADPEARDSISFECDAEGWVCAVCHDGGDVLRLVALRHGLDPRADFEASEVARRRDRAVGRARGRTRARA